MKSERSQVVIRRASLFLLILLCITMAVPIASWPQTSIPENYYKGKSIEIIVPYPAGGGTDVFSRYLTPWLSKYIPGNPVILVRNMPGANTLIGTNYVYNIAKKDGLTMMASGGGVNLNSLLQLKGCEFNLNNMPMVLASPQGIVFSENAPYILRKFICCVCIS